jgi:hypothetical protein
MGAILESLDARFVQIYGVARAERVAHEQRRGLIVVRDDVMLLFRGDEPVRQFTGLEPPLYNKMKTLGHIPLAIFCLLHAVNDGPLSRSVRGRLVSYRALLDSAGREFDLTEEIEAGILPRPIAIHAMAKAFLGSVLKAGTTSRHALHGFTRGVCDDVDLVLAVAARAQLAACDRTVKEIRALFPPEEWAELRVLVLGPYMAKQGEIFLQYFSKELNTTVSGDRRLIYFDGDDLKAAYERFGTATLDAEAAQAIFGNRRRLHRDVLADATREYLSADNDQRIRADISSDSTDL